MTYSKSSKSEREKELLKIQQEREMSAAGAGRGQVVRALMRALVREVRKVDGCARLRAAVVKDAVAMRSMVAGKNEDGKGAWLEVEKFACRAVDEEDDARNLSVTTTTEATKKAVSWTGEEDEGQTTRMRTAHRCVVEGFRRNAAAAAGGGSAETAASSDDDKDEEMLTSGFAVLRWLRTLSNHEQTDIVTNQSILDIAHAPTHVHDAAEMERRRLIKSRMVPPATAEHDEGGGVLSRTSTRPFRRRRGRRMRGSSSSCSETWIRHRNNSSTCSSIKGGGGGHAQMVPSLRSKKSLRWKRLEARERKKAKANNRNRAKEVYVAVIRI